MCVRSGPDARANQPSQITFMQNFLTEVQKDYSAEEAYVTCPIGVLFLLSTLFGSGAARGRTATQMAHTLQLRSPFNESNLAVAMNEAKVLYNDLYDDLTSQETFIQERRANVMTVKNGIFTRTDYELKPKFVQSVERDFKSTKQQLDFTNQSESARYINNWVNSETRGLIQRIFSSPGELPADTRVALFNIFTFKDKWYRPFMLHDTRANEFYVSSSRTIRVPTMNSIETIPYADIPSMGISMIKKPLYNHRFSLIAILPSERFNLGALTPILDGRVTIKELFPNMDERAVALRLPKFKIEATKDLITTLRKMGIVDLFIRGHADLSGMTTSERLFINLLKQSVVLKVDEAGVEAAAVTGAVAVPTSFITPEVEFHANHPFLCMIYDEHLHIPLVVARVMEPGN